MRLVNPVSLKRLCVVERLMASVHLLVFKPQETILLRSSCEKQPSGAQVGNLPSSPFPGRVHKIGLLTGPMAVGCNRISAHLESS